MNRKKPVLDCIRVALFLLFCFRPVVWCALKCICFKTPLRAHVEKTYFLRAAQNRNAIKLCQSITSIISTEWLERNIENNFLSNLQIILMEKFQTLIIEEAKANQQNYFNYAKMIRQCHNKQNIKLRANQPEASNYSSKESNRLDKKNKAAGR